MRQQRGELRVGNTRVAALVDAAGLEVGERHQLQEKPALPGGQLAQLLDLVLAELDEERRGLARVGDG